MPVSNKLYITLLIGLNLTSLLEVKGSGYKEAFKMRYKSLLITLISKREDLFWSFLREETSTKLAGCQLHPENIV